MTLPRSIARFTLWVRRPETVPGWERRFGIPVLLIAAVLLSASFLVLRPWGALLFGPAQLVSMWILIQMARRPEEKE